MKKLKWAVLALAILAPTAAAADPACDACMTGCDNVYATDAEGWMYCVSDCWGAGGPCMATLPGGG